MDSVIAKLDNSVFGMLIEQPPHILITGIKEEDVGFIDRVRPDFVCLEDENLKKKLCPVVRVIGSPADLPPISGVHEASALTLDPGTSSEDIKEKIRKEKPDIVMIELKRHGEDEYMSVRNLIRAVRSVRPEMID